MTMSSYTNRLLKQYGDNIVYPNPRVNMIENYDSSIETINH